MKFPLRRINSLFSYILMYPFQGCHRHLTLVVTLLTGLIGLAGCVPGSDSGEPRQAPETIEAHTQSLKTTQIPRHFSTSGTVTTDHRVAVSSRLSGYIRKMPVREGQRVSKGTLLFRIDPVDARQALEQAEADLKNISADLKRYQGLLDEHAVSQQAFDRVRLQYTVARSRMLQAKNQLKYASVTSPVSGFVVEKRANTGDLASPGKPVLIVEDPSHLLVETHISERVIARIETGDKVDVRVPALATHFAGRIRQIVTAADPLTHQFLVKITLEQNTGVLPGMFVEIGFPIGQRQVLLVPQAAIVHRAGLDGIYIVDTGGVAHYRQIRVGRSTGGGVEVLAGLDEGDRIAWREDHSLRSGHKVLNDRP